MPAAAQRTAGGVFLTFPEDLRPLSAIDYIMYCRSRYIPTSEVGGAEKRLSSPEKRLTAPAKYAILPSALMLVWLSWQSSSLVMSRSPVRIRPQAPKPLESQRFMFIGTQCDLWGRPVGTGHEKISRGNFPRLIFSLIPSLSERQHFIGYADLIWDITLDEISALCLFLGRGPFFA